MNDFTKKELEILWQAIYEYDLSRDSSDWADPDISKKIQFMIDNYCEHNWAFYISPHGNTVRCQKCNKGIPE
jgi:hypothetical protein